MIIIGGTGHSEVLTVSIARMRIISEVEKGHVEQLIITSSGIIVPSHFIPLREI
jgi:hypothetical protein